jgi:hypothetical protein
VRRSFADVLVDTGRKADRKGYRLSAPGAKPIPEYSAMDKRISLHPSRRGCLPFLAGLIAAWSPSALAEDRISKPAFDQWVAAFARVAYPMRPIRG